MGSLSRENVFLIFGNGYIANQIKEILLEQGVVTIMSKVRIENREQVMNEIERHKPLRVINCAAVRDPDWCDENRVGTMRSNVLGAMNVADVCHEMGVHLTYFGSGCIYTVDEKEINTHPGFKETDEPFFKGCFYCESRLLGELSIRHYPNLLTFRVRVPIGADLDPSNHLTKLLKQGTITDFAGSGAILPNLLPGAVILSNAGETGIFNLVTPGVISNTEIMELAKKYVRPDHSWQTAKIEDTLRSQNGTRAYSILDNTKVTQALSKYGYRIKQRTEALEELFQLMQAKGL